MKNLNSSYGVYNTLFSAESQRLTLKTPRNIPRGMDNLLLTVLLRDDSGYRLVDVHGAFLILNLDWAIFMSFDRKKAERKFDRLLSQEPNTPGDYKQIF